MNASTRFLIFIWVFRRLLRSLPFLADVEMDSLAKSVYYMAVGDYVVELRPLKVIESISEYL